MVQFRRRHFIVTSSTLLAAPLAVHSQPAARVRRIGVLSAFADPKADEWIRENLGAALHRVGYVAGRNIDIDWRLSVPFGASLDEAAVALVRRNAELVVVFGNHELLAARRATTTLPIVMMFSLAPVELGVARSLARPGGNVTGTLYAGFETAAKTLELLKEAKPTIASVAVLRNPAFPGGSAFISLVERAAATLGLRLEYFDATRPAEIGLALDRIAARRPEALLFVGDSVITGKQAGPFAIAHKLVSFGNTNAFAWNGGLFSYAPDPVEIVERAAAYVDRILRGARAADLPIELPT